MKILFTTIAAVFLSLACFSQHKGEKITSQPDLTKALTSNDSTPKKVAPPVSLPQPNEKWFHATMTLTEWQYLMFLIRNNGKLTGAQTEEYIEELESILVPVKDSIKTK